MVKLVCVLRLREGRAEAWCGSETFDKRRHMCGSVHAGRLGHGGDTEDVDVDDAQIPDDQDGELPNGESNLADAEQPRL